jgi:hypothetical protein
MQYKLSQLCIYSFHWSSAIFRSFFSNAESIHKKIPIIETKFWNYVVKLRSRNLRLVCSQISQK